MQLCNLTHSNTPVVEVVGLLCVLPAALVADTVME